MKESITQINKRLNELLSYHRFQLGGSDVSLRVSAARLATSFVLTEHMLNKGVQLRNEALDALRGALYLFAFEIKRIRMPDENREKLVADVIEPLLRFAPTAMEKAAEQAADSEQLKRLDEKIISLAPVLQKSRRNRSTNERINSILVRSGVALGLWMLGGQSMVDMMTSNVALEILFDQVGHVIAPLGTAILTAVLTRNRDHLMPNSQEAVQAYNSFCESILGAVNTSQ